MLTLSCVRSASVIAWILASMVLVGCGSDPSSTESIDAAEQAITVCAKGETVEGIDVSVWQGAVDWQSVKNAGITFGIARVSYGTSLDNWFDDNWNGMKSVGLIRGAYQFFLPQQDPIAQAELMISAMGSLGAGDLPPVVDVEDTGGQSKATIAAKLKDWCQHVEAATGKKPIIYTGKYFWQDNVASDDFGEYPLWIPNYSFSCPNLPDNYWNDWVIFQYSSTGSVPGISGNVDRNKFNGTLSDLQAYANGGPSYAAKFVSQSFPYASQGAVQIAAGEKLDAFIEMRNVGTKPWDSNTLLATTEPRDRTSPFAGPEWPGPNRYARVEGVVPPGETFKFGFTMHAPLETGVYDEHFGLVQEGVTWFSDPGQGGPPDGQLEGLFEVVPNSNAGGAGGAGVGGAGGAGVGGEGGFADWMDDGGDGAQTSGPIHTEASCAVTEGKSGSASWLLTVVVGLGLVARRRRS
jgi:lysozyme